MMSTGTVAEISAEQTFVTLVSSNHSAAEEFSFAQSFDKGISATIGTYADLKMNSLIKNTDRIVTPSYTKSLQEHVHTPAAEDKAHKELLNPAWMQNPTPDGVNAAESIMQDNIGSTITSTSFMSAEDSSPNILYRPNSEKNADTEIRPWSRVFSDFASLNRKQTAVDIGKQPLVRAIETSKCQQNNSMWKFTRNGDFAKAKTIPISHSDATVNSPAQLVSQSWLPSLDSTRVKPIEQLEGGFMSGDNIKGNSVKSREHGSVNDAAASDSLQAAGALDTKVMVNAMFCQYLPVKLESDKVAAASIEKPTTIGTDTRVEMQTETLLASKQGVDTLNENSHFILSGLPHVGAEDLAASSSINFTAATHLASTNVNISQNTHTVHPMINVSMMQEDIDGSSSLLRLSAPDMPKLLKATATSLEVEIVSNAHGLLKVRTELTEGGAINASISGNHSDSQAMLHQELSGIASYLQQEKVYVDEITVHSSNIRSSEEGSAAVSSGEDGGQTRQGGGHRQTREDYFGGTSVDKANEVSPNEGWNCMDEESLISLPINIAGGVWLSIRA